MSDIQGRIRETASKLLEDNVVTMFIGWGATRFEEKTSPLFIREPDSADKLVYNENCVNMLSKYLLDYRYSDEKIAVCARGCDSRAINRMIKDKQIEREKVYIVGIPCEGTSDERCRRCGYRNPVVYDIMLGTELDEAPNPARFADVEELESLNSKERCDYWNGQFSKCIRCYACRNACPACNCIECYTDRNTVSFQGKACDAAENQVFGMTRAFHVGDRCIECGECERVCPMHLPLTKLTGKLIKDIGELFGDYRSGFDSESPSALGTFDKQDHDEFM